MAGPAKDSRATLFAICVALIGITWLVFGQTVGFDFVNYDDATYVQSNPLIQRGLTREGLGKAFTTPHSGNWHPVTTLSHMVDCQLWDLHSGAHHATSVAIHTLVVVLLFLLLRSITGWLWSSAFVAAVFAIHPLRAESVAWIAERKDVLSALFFVLTLLAYVRYAKRPTIWAYCLVLCAFILGLMSKPMLVTMPLVLLLLDYWPLNRVANRQERIRAVWEKLAMLALSALAAVVTLWAQKQTVASFEVLPLSLRIGNGLVACLIYLKQLLWPVGFSVFYPYPERGLPIWEVVGASVIILGISAAAVVLRKRWPFFVTGWFWYLIMLIPVIGIVQVGSQSHADRYTYLPQIGILLILAGWIAAAARAQLFRTVGTPIAFFCIGILAWRGFVQTSSWRNSETLWNRAIAETGDFHAHHGLGHFFLNQGRLPEAIAEFETTLRLKPRYPDAHFNLAIALEQSGKPSEAIDHLRQAVAARPNYPEAYCRLGNDLLATDQPDEAIREYQTALAQRPHYPEVHYNLGMVFTQKGDMDDAQMEYERAIKDNPNYAEAYYGLGNLLLQSGRVEDAIAKYQQALRARPDYVEVENNLASAFLVEGKTGDAIEQWETTLARHGSSIEVMNNLAWVLATYPDERFRNGTKAVELSERAESLSHSSNAGVLRTLAAAYAEVGRFDRAIEVAERARDLARDQQNFDLAVALRDELALYQSNKPVRVTPPSR